jgi:hypothetical protein
MSTRTADRQITEAKTEGAVTPIADANDAIAANRSVRYLRKDAVAAVPVGYIAPELTARRQRIQWVSADSESELLDAARELAARADKVPQELGDLAPALGDLGELIVRVDGLQGTVAALRELLAAHEHLLELGLSDMHNVVTGCHDEYAHRAPRRPALATHYTRVVKYVTLRGQRVVEGRARARATQSLVDAAAAQAQPEPAGRTPS